MALTQEQKKPLIDKFQQTGTDTGSTQVQIALLTERINLLTEHMKKNKKDFACLHGMMKLVGQRRRLQTYCKKKVTPEEYKKLMTTLKLRK